VQVASPGQRIRAAMIDRGIFSLKTPHQLFEKLKRDYAHVRSSPDDSDGWFNFFVTADHLADWFCGDEAAAKKMQQSNALLRIVHRLSINAKHHEQKSAKPGTVRLSPVEYTHEARVFSLDQNQSPPQPVEAGKAFWLELSPTEASEFGSEFVSAQKIALGVVEFWAKQLDVPI
jgi:hypothetical protein